MVSVKYTQNMKRVLFILLFIPIFSFSQISYKDVMSIKSVDMFKKVLIENGYEYDSMDDSQALMQHQQRQLAKMARAGFAMKIGRTVLELEDIDAVEQLIDKLEKGEDPTM